MHKFKRRKNHPKNINETIHNVAAPNGFQKIQAPPLQQYH